MQRNEKRIYQRGDHFECTALISEDGSNWFEADITDLSSGGLMFQYERKYRPGELLWFDISAGSLFSEFQIKTKGKICRVQDTGERFAYGIAFVELEPDTKIWIDENILQVKQLGMGISDMFTD